MLSVQIIPPASGTLHLRFGLSGWQLDDVARPRDRGDEVALRERPGVVVARELPDLAVVDGLLDGVDRLFERLVRHGRRVVAVRGMTRPTVSAISFRSVTFPLSFGSSSSCSTEVIGPGDSFSF